MKDGKSPCLNTELFCLLSCYTYKRFQIHGKFYSFFRLEAIKKLGKEATEQESGKGMKERERKE